MPQLLLIVVFLLVSAPDLLGVHEPEPFGSPWRAVAWTLACQATICLLAWPATATAIRAVDRTGSLRPIRRAEQYSLLLRWVSVLVHGASIFTLGWVSAVRALVGDQVLLDELLAVSPVIGVWVFSWWMIEPLERRLREAILLRRLDAGGPLYPVLTRAGFVWQTFRHQVLVLLAPMLVIMGWSEGVERWAMAHWPGSIGAEGRPADWRVVALQLAGIGAAFAVMPLALTRIWDTTPLGTGHVRDRIAALCSSARVRVREILVWRTSGLLVNAAAVGFLRPLRYILLSDALLDHLSQRQVEAVAAHEIGHVRRHHMVWLGVVVLASLLGVSVVASLFFEFCRRTPILKWIAALPDESTGPWFLVATFVACMSVFGFVSRRFEWQADAFAVQCLSRLPAEGEHAAAIVTPEAAHAMIGALAVVASLSGIARERFSWRHGSIATRQRRLAAVVGQAVDRLSIDRQALAIKLLSLLVLGASAAWMLFAPAPP